MGKLKNIQGNFKTFRRRFDFFPVETLFSEHGHRDGAYTVACLFAEMRRNGGIDSAAECDHQFASRRKSPERFRIHEANSLSTC